MKSLEELIKELKIKYCSRIIMYDTTNGIPCDHCSGCILFRDIEEDVIEILKEACNKCKIIKISKKPIKEKL